MKVLIFGGGMWGATLAKVIAENNHHCLIYDINQENVNLINTSHKTINDLILPTSITATTNICEAREFASKVVLAIPSKVVRSSLGEFLSSSIAKFHIISATKGLEHDSGKTISQLASDVLKDKLDAFYTIQGPSFAGELYHEQLTFLLLTCKEKQKAEQLLPLFQRPYLICKAASDIIGIEMCGPVKNAFAVLTGFMKGMDLGENAVAAVIALLLDELSKLIVDLGGSKDTIYSVAGVGDLVLTASSPTSRNFRAGLGLAKGLTPSQIIAVEKETIEGFDAINGLSKLIKQTRKLYPLINCLTDIINGLFNKQSFIKMLSNV